jgi:hypothetical protein
MASSASPEAKLAEVNDLITDLNPAVLDKPVQILTTDLEVQLFGPDDPYRWDIENRPLRKLIENDMRLRDALNELGGVVGSFRKKGDLYEPNTPVGQESSYVAGNVPLRDRIAADEMIAGEINRLRRDGTIKVTRHIAVDELPE